MTLSISSDLLEKNLKEITTDNNYDDLTNYLKIFKPNIIFNLQEFNSKKEIFDYRLPSKPKYYVINFKNCIFDV